MASPFIEATGENASFGIVASQRGWGDTDPGRLLETVLQTLVANPVIVVDEIEKAGSEVSSKGHTFGLAEALLPLLEPMTAKRWSRPYCQAKFDMSRDIRGVTANISRHLSPLLLSRCPQIRLRDLSIAELGDPIRREGANPGLPTEAIGQALASLSVGQHRPGLRVAAACCNGLPIWNPRRCCTDPHRHPPCRPAKLLPIGEY
ncbi:MAG: hypothetical protein WBP18_12750 [Paracoccaceae bacterium]